MEINTPPMSTGRSTEERLREIERYLFYLAQQLNFNFEDLDKQIKNIGENIGGK